MNNLCFAVASSLPIVLAGREYEARPLLLADLAAVELFMRRERGEPAVLAEAGAGNLQGYPALAASLIKWGLDDQRELKAKPYTMDDILVWLARIQGVAFTAWRCLIRRERRAFDGPLAARRFVAKLSDAERRTFMECVFAASGLDQPAMLEWQRPAHLRQSKVTAADSEKKRKGIPWRQFLRKAALDFGWTPEQLGTLTYWQVWTYIVEEAELGGVQRMSAVAGLAMASKIKRASGKDAAPVVPATDTREMHPARRAAMAKLERERQESLAAKAGGGNVRRR